MAKLLVEMDGILALGHFCETHGPCVVLCTQKHTGEPVQGPHSLTVPWCEACQSLQLDQALISREATCCYVTTRTPLQQDLAFLLKHATVRSLSCEQDGTLYFGDNERGHVFSHSFMVHDSLARGFQRKYTILMLMRDKIHLLNLWPLLVEHIKEIARVLQEYSAEINNNEQAQRPQRAVRQAQSSPSSTARSLSQLTGRPAIYAHIHLWFTWLLGCETVIEKPFVNQLLPKIKPSSLLRSLVQDMGREMFSRACSLITIGVPLKSNDNCVVEAFYSIFPDPTWKQNMDYMHYCIVIRQENGSWQFEADVRVPENLSTFQKDIERFLIDKRLTESSLEPQLTATIMQWLQVARVLTWCPQIDFKLLQCLNVQKYDVPLLTFWTSNCTGSTDKHKSIVKSLHNIYFNK